MYLRIVQQLQEKVIEAYSLWNSFLDLSIFLIISCKEKCNYSIHTAKIRTSNKLVCRIYAINLLYETIVFKLIKYLGSILNFFMLLCENYYNISLQQTHVYVFITTYQKSRTINSTTV